MGGITGAVGLTRVKTNAAATVFGQAWAAGSQYVTQVNKGRLNAESHTDYLNAAYGQGFRLHTIFEQDGNTVMVFERRDG